MRRRRILISVLAVVVLLGAIGAYFALHYEPGADDSYDTHVPTPVLVARHPRVLFDSGHRNVHSLHGRFKPFARLIESDGCIVTSSSAVFSPELFEPINILVVVNAEGPESDRTRSAFTSAECDAVKGWVHAGGSLLLIADHHPFGEAAAELASRFGVEMSGGWTDDEANARAGSGDPGQLLFARVSGRLVNHAITRGHSLADLVGTVETFTGQSLKGPPDSVALLLLGKTAMDRIPVSANRTESGSQTITTFQTDDRSAAGRCQGLAMRFGKGRIVVLGEAAMCSAQVDANTGQRFGMNAPHNDNRAFTLNIIRWLAGAMED